MTEIEAREIFERNNAIKEGHFVLRGGEHPKWYVDKNIVLQNPKQATPLYYALAGELMDLNPDIIIGPQMGGALMAPWIAYYLTRFLSHGILGLYAEKSRNGFKLRPQAIQIMADKRVVVVDDVLQRGTSLEAMMKAIDKTGGIVVGFGLLWHRGQTNLTNFFNRNGNLISLINTKLVSWPNEKLCPLCGTIPINTDLGYGKEFLNQKRAADRFAETSHRLATA